MKFRKKPVIIEATQWFKNGDLIDVVQMYSESYITDNKCNYCNTLLLKHGWIRTLEGGHIVCPGDWIITGVKGEMYPCKLDIFEATYEPV